MVPVCAVYLDEEFPAGHAGNGKCWNTLYAGTLSLFSDYDSFQYITVIELVHTDGNKTVHSTETVRMYWYLKYFQRVTS